MGPGDAGQGSAGGVEVSYNSDSGLSVDYTGGEFAATEGAAAAPVEQTEGAEAETELHTNPVPDDDLQEETNQESNSADEKVQEVKEKKEEYLIPGVGIVPEEEYNAYLRYLEDNLKKQGASDSKYGDSGFTTYGGPTNSNNDDPDIPAGGLPGGAGSGTMDRETDVGTVSVNLELDGGGIKDQLREWTERMPTDPNYEGGDGGPRDRDKEEPKISYELEQIEESEPVVTVAEAEADEDLRDGLLNILGLTEARSEILGQHEYIPIASDITSENDSVSKLDLGVETTNYTKITSAGRLIELHRQVRSYINDTADVVMKELYPYLNDKDFLTQLRNVTRGRLSFSVASDLNLTPDEFLRETLETLIDNILQTVETVSAERATIIRENKDNPVFRGIVEYYILERLIEYIVPYSNNLSLLYSSHRDFWGIDKFAGLKPFNANDITNQDVSDDFKNLSLFNELGSSYDYSLYEKVTGVSRQSLNARSKVTDMQVYTQLASSLVALTNFVDSTYYLEDFKENNTKYMPDDKVHYGLNGDLGRILKKIDRMQIKSYSFVGDSMLDKTDDFGDLDFTGAAASGGLGFQTGTTLVGDVSPSLLQDLKNNFQRISPDSGSDSNLFTIIKGIKDKNGQEKSETETLKELLAYGAQEFMNAKINITARAQNGSESAQSTIDFLEDLGIDTGSLAESSRLELGEFLSSGFLSEELLNQSLSTRTKQQLIVSKISLSPYFRSLFANEVSSASSLSARRLYSLESIKTNRQLDTRQIGSNYYSYKATNDGDVSEFKDLVIDYRTKVNSITEAVLTLYPDRDIINAINPSASDIALLTPTGRNNSFDYLVNVFNDLADDLESIYTSNDTGFRRRQIALIMLMEAAVDDITKNFLLNSSFLGVLGKDGNTIGENDTITKTSYYEIDRSEWRQKAKGVSDGLLSNFAKKRMRALVSTYVLDELEREGFDWGADIIDWFQDLGTDVDESGSVFSYPLTPTVNNNIGYTVKTNFKENYFFENFRKALANEDYEENRNDLSNPDLGRTYATSIGMQRLFPQSMRRYIKGSSNNTSINELYSGEEISNRFASRHYVFFMFARKLILNNITFFKSSNHIPDRSTRSGEANVVIDGLKGIVAGIRAGIKEAKGLSVTTPGLSTLTTSGEEDAYYNVKNTISETLEKITIRQRMIKEHLAMINGHASAFYDLFLKLVQLVDLGDPNLFNLLKKTLKSPVFGGNLLRDISNYANGTYTEQMIDSSNKIFKAKEGTLIPRDVNFLLRKNKLMYNTFSLPGLGLLDSEKRGNKTILNIGLTNGLLTKLKEEAFPDDPIGRINASIVISVRKIDTLNPDMILMPKNFIFSDRIFICDYNNQGLSNHLENYNNSQSLDSILQNLERTSYTHTSNTYTANYNSGFNLDSKVLRDLHINHLMDYLLKHYQLVTSGLNFDESSFLLKLSPNIYRRAYAGPFTGDSLVDEFLNVLARLKRAYPQVFNNRQLQSEAERMVNVLKQSFPFSNTRRFEKTVRPKSFDRVFSVLVNEKDFIPHQSFENEYDIFFPETPNFTASSLITAPSLEKLSELERINYDDDSLNRYFDGVLPNQPEMYHYAVSIGVTKKTIAYDYGSQSNTDESENESNSQEKDLGLIKERQELSEVTRNNVL
jgi:hypothetical protein